MYLRKLGYAVLINNLATEIPDTTKDIETLRSALKRTGFMVSSRNNLNYQVML